MRDILRRLLGWKAAGTPVVVVVTPTECIHAAITTDVIDAAVTTDMIHVRIGGLC